MRKTFAVICIMILLTAALSGCVLSTGGGDGDIKKKDTIVILINGEPASLDPLAGEDYARDIVLQFVCENLFELGSDTVLLPELLEEYETRGMIFTGKLREGIKFSNGEELTTDDLMWTLERLAEKYGESGRFRFLNMEDSSAEDAYSFEIHFTQAWEPYKDAFAAAVASITSKADFDAQGGAIGETIVGTGPYKIESWERGTEIRLTRNENYHGEAAKTKNIIIKFAASEEIFASKMKSDQPDIALSLTDSEAESLLPAYDYEIIQTDSYRIREIVFPTSDKYLSNQKVREALLLAVDQKAIMALAEEGTAKAINGYCSPIMSAYSDMGTMEQDVDAAKKLMGEAGVPGGFEIEVETPNSEIEKKIVNELKTYWAQIGVNANLFLEGTKPVVPANGRMPIYVMDISATDISDVLSIFEMTSQDAINTNDELLEAMLLDLRTYYDNDAERSAALKTLLEYLHEQHLAYPLTVMPERYAVRGDVRGLEVHPAAGYLSDMETWEVFE